MQKFNVIGEINELKNQLSYSKSFGFFFGAGTSCALGVPNITTLTESIKTSISNPYDSSFNKIYSELATIQDSVNIEDILNFVRQIRSITREREDKKYLDISGEHAKKLDSEICKLIYKEISFKEASADLKITKKFFAWLNMQNKSFSTELFTSNYDLIFEKSLEAIKSPYFDGFVGSYEPFFWQDSIDKFVEVNDLTQNWLRLWKIHGSLNWFWKENKDSHSIIRSGGQIPDIKTLDKELVIYPSKEKYDSSKKMPFVAYFDRLKKVLQNGELLFIISGYSFSDQHINEVFFNSLRLNNRLSIIVFFFLDSEVEKLYETSSGYLNLSVYGPNKSIIGGEIGEWTYNKDNLNDSESSDMYWDCDKNHLILGDYNSLVDFLVTNSGKKEIIEDAVNGK